MFLTSENKLNFNRLIFGATLTCVLVLTGIFWFDIPLFMFLRSFNYGIQDTIGTIFSAKNWLVLSILIVLIFYIKKTVRTKPRLSLVDFYNKVKASYAFWIFSAVFLAISTGAILKFIIGRMRPVFFEALGITGFFPFTYDDAFHSMPSGHTMASFAGLVMIGMLAPRWKYFSWGLATIIAISRVCAGMHWPSDIIFGAFWGILCAELVHAWMVRRIK